MKSRIAPSGLRSRYCRGAYDDPAATGRPARCALAPALRLPEPSETPPARPEGARPGARPDKPAVPCPKGKLTACHRGPLPRAAATPAWRRVRRRRRLYPGERGGAPRKDAVVGAGPGRALRLEFETGPARAGAPLEQRAPASRPRTVGTPTPSAPPPARGRRRERGWARAADPATGGGREGAGRRPGRLGPARRPRFGPSCGSSSAGRATTCAQPTVSRVTKSSRRERGRVGWHERHRPSRHVIELASRRWRGGRDAPRQFDLCTGDDRKGPAPATRSRSFLIYATSASPRRWRSRHAARSRDGVLRLDASGGRLAPGVAGAPGDRTGRAAERRARRRGESGPRCPAATPRPRCSSATGSGRCSTPTIR